MQPFIKCFWSLEAPESSIAEKQRIVPDGCMEMIFHYGDLYRQYFEDGNCIVQPRCFVFGQITSPLEIAPSGVSGIIAARFHSDGFFPFSPVSLNEMENKAVVLHILFGKEGLQLEEQVLNAAGNEARIKIIESFLIKKLQTEEATSRIAKQSVDVLIQSKGQMSVDELAGELQINRRRLERKFSETIGLSPKQFLK